MLALCGSRNEALRQAGLAIRHDQPGRRTGRGARRSAAQRYLDGESSTAIAVDLGCHPATVLKWVRATGGKTKPHGRPRAPPGPEAAADVAVPARSEGCCSLKGRAAEPSR